MKTLNVSERDIRLNAAMRNAIKRIAAQAERLEPMSFEGYDYRQIAAVELCRQIVNAPVKDWETAMEEIEAAIAAL